MNDLIFELFLLNKTPINSHIKHGRKCGRGLALQCKVDSQGAKIALGARLERITARVTLLCKCVFFAIANIRLSILISAFDNTFLEEKGVFLRRD